MRKSHNAILWLSEGFSRLALWSFEHRWWVFTGSLILLSISVWLSTSLRTDNSFEAYFDHEDPIYSAYRQFREDFGSDETSFILYQAPETAHGPFDLDVMQRISRLTDALQEEVPFIYEVTSLANSELIEGDEDGITVQSWREDFAGNQQSLLAMRDKVLQKKIYLGGLVSPDAKHAAILIDMDRSSVDPIEVIKLDPSAGDDLDNIYPQVTMDKITEILSRPEYSGIHFWHSGDVALNTEMNRTLTRESFLLGTIAAVVISILLLALFQFRLLGVAGPLLVVACSVMLARAFVALMDWRLDMMSMMMPVMIITIGVAAAVHILSEFWLYYEKTGDRREAIKETMYLVGPPCLFTALTTAAGFMAMSISPIKAISHMGFYIPVGILASFLLSITLLVFFLSFGRRKARQDKPEFLKWCSNYTSGLLTALADFNIRYRKPLLVFFALGFAVSVVGISKIQIDSNFIEEFSDDSQVKITTKYIDRVMGGTSGIVYLFDTQSEDGITDPAVLREIERIQAEVDTQGYLVKKTYSVVDLLKDINQSFHGDNPDYYRIPESRELVAQLLLVYEISGGDELSRYVSPDYSRANVEIRARNTEASMFGRFKKHMDAYLLENPVNESSMTMTGIGRLWLQLLDHITVSQIKGLSLAIVIITLMMCFVFRSIKTGLISMIPNITPVFFTLGFMGWVGLDLDYTRLMISTIALGIAVDDTIHMVTRFNHEYQRTGNYELALHNTFNSVGRALTITTLVLVMGFLVFTLSSMNGTVWFGALMAMTVSLALVADFFLMPALILAFKPFGKEWNTQQVKAVNQRVLYQNEQQTAQEAIAPDSIQSTEPRDNNICANKKTLLED